MLNVFVSTAMGALMSVLTPDKVQGFIRAAVDKLQAHVKATENKLDDALIPATELVLAALKVPGKDGEIDVTNELLKLFTVLGDQKNFFIDAGLDWIENKVEASESKLDDDVVLPMCALVRKVLNVPDDDHYFPALKE